MGFDKLSAITDGIFRNFSQTLSHFCSYFYNKCLELFSLNVICCKYKSNKYFQHQNIAEMLRIVPTADRAKAYIFMGLTTRFEKKMACS